jgi:NAD(P)-dependent dehydrogenase (short-subunit alcohol dehydrogenase family)
LKLPVGRAERPEETAEAVVFLMTDGFVTGVVLPVDGGGGLV